MYVIVAAIIIFLGMAAFSFTLHLDMERLSTAIESLKK